MMVLRNDNGQRTVYLGKLYQHNLGTNVQTKHYAFNGKLVAMHEGGYTFLLTDHLGSVNVTLAANGTLGSRLRYDPWGKQRYAQNVTPTGYRYTAQRFDDKLGLYDYNARYYDPAIGRFLSADTLVPVPTNPQSFNRYAYVHNNPLIYTDPTGHWLESAWDAFNVVLGAYSLYDNLSQGNYGWAALDAGGLVVDTAALVVPIVPGGVSSIIKGARGVDAAVDVVQAVNQSSNGFSVVTRYADEVVETATSGASSASSSSLRQNLGLQAGDGYQAHHLIPNQWKDHPLIQATGGQWNQNAASNGMALPSRAGLNDSLPIHNGPHPAYNQQVLTMLDNANTPGITPQLAQANLMDIANNLRHQLSKGGGHTVNQLHLHN